MRQFRVPVRAAASFMTITLLLVLLGIFSVWKMHEMRALAINMEHNSMASIIVINKLNAAGLKLRVEYRRLIAQKDAQQRNDTLQRIKLVRTDYLNHQQAYAPLVSSDNEQQVYQRVIDTGVLFFNALDSVEALVRKDTPDELSAYMDTDVVPAVTTLQTAMDTLMKINTDQAAQSGKDSELAYASALRFVITVIVISVLVTALLAVLLTRSIVHPLQKLLVINESIARGDLSHPIIADGKDEFTQLMISSQHMQSSLKETISLIGLSSTQLASAAEELNAVTDESSRGLARQNNEIDQAATAVNEMTAAVDEVARNSSAASDAAKQADKSAHYGSDNVIQTVQAIQQLSATIDSTSQNVEELAAHSQNISKVLTVIGAIAEQTNLLALNAAIEAARAGDLGRGFAVVADEVRALAHRTQASTSEIEQMISEIAKGTHQATLAMQASCSQAQSTLAVAHKAGDTIQEITEAVEKINEMNLLIATASEEQAQVARSVDSNLVSIRDLSIQSSAGAHQTAAASSELSRLAIDMNQLVARFKVD